MNIELILIICTICISFGTIFFSIKSLLDTRKRNVKEFIQDRNKSRKKYNSILEGDEMVLNEPQEQYQKIKDQKALLKIYFEQRHIRANKEEILNALLEEYERVKNMGDIQTNKKYEKN